MGFFAFQILVVLAVVGVMVFFQRDDALTRHLRPVKIRKDVHREIKRR